MRRAGLVVGALIVIAACAGLGWWMQESAAQHREADRRLAALEAAPEHDFVVLARNIVSGQGLCLTYTTAFGPQRECKNVGWEDGLVDCWDLARLGEIIPDCWRQRLLETTSRRRRLMAAKSQE